ncbi:MAG: hypothetical protein HYU66_08170 [Armatimonadetes bacterium]|nr:hypothetical protein [Armatimonadota bacterium]
MRRWILPLLAAVLAATLLGQVAPPGELRFEAEDCSEPKDAWVANKELPGRWNLWSTDNDALRKWSGGVVLRSPNVAADRALPEDGAAPLHVHLTGIPKGAYDISLKLGRVLGVSLDGLTWQPYRGGILAGGVQIDNGTFDLWVDDRYVDKDGPGPCYFDCVLLRPAVAVKDGLVNPGYEAAEGEAPTGWHWWSREGVGSAAAVTDQKHSGERAVHIVHPGTKDWAFSPDAGRRAKPGEELVVRGWVKCSDTAAVQLCVVAEGGGKLLTWDCGSASSSGTHDWKEIAGEATVPAGADAIYVRWVGNGKADVWVDEVSLQPGRIPLPTRPLVKGCAQTRVEERLDRGAVAVRAARGYHVSWRMLKGDPADVAFNVWRQDGSAAPKKVNPAPVRWTTDYLDDQAPDGVECSYQVATVVGGKEQRPPAVAQSSGLQYLRLKLDGNYTVQKCVPADLDGDGQLDWVLKQPGDNIDPYETYWQKSPDTYKIEAWTHDGKLLWRHDLGWAIERGIWYSRPARRRRAGAERRGMGGGVEWADREGDRPRAMARSPGP